MKTICKILLFAALTIIGTGCEQNPPKVSAQDYYWYEGSKILLERGNQEYIVYNDALLLKSDKEKVIESGDLSYPEMVNLKWGITKPDAVLEDVEHVLYRTPSYKNSEDNNMFITHRFYVKLKENEDLSVLQKMAEKYNAKIEQDVNLPSWHILSCGLPSAFNALELANIFYETELFAASEPEFIGGTYITSIDQVTNHQSQSTKKMLHNGMLIIESDGKTYNIMGVEVGQ